MFSCASSVDPPICGVKITFDKPCNGVSNASPFFSGSHGNTSIAAPEICLLFNASFNASKSTLVLLL